MRHLDLFSGIGGFAYAVDGVWPGTEHIFCDNDSFCRAVLAKHWLESVVYHDIKDITADSYRSGLPGPDGPGASGFPWAGQHVDLLTGGFPCQPFSASGARRGTADDRYLWPEMLRVIQLVQSEWVIAENVRGLATWNDGMVLEQVCADLEATGYEVQPLIIPASAVGAPHRRDRIWFIAHTKSNRHKREVGLEWKPVAQTAQHSYGSSNATDSGRKRRQAGSGESLRSESQEPIKQNGQDSRRSWDDYWAEVAAELCSVDDGLPAELGDFTATKAQHRNAQIKAYGNAIVPQVAMQIMQAIKEISR